MFCKFCITILCCLLFFAEDCGSQTSGGATGTAARESAQAAAPTAAPVSAPPTETLAAATNAQGRDACGLIEKSEIASVQGQPVQSVFPSQQPDGNLAVSQCYYTVISADGSKNLSVHLQLAEDANSTGSQRSALREFWKSKFGHEAERERKAEKEEEEEAGEPLRVRGIGDEAYWVGDSKMGALYVLKKDRMLRVSIGGPDEPQKKIEKSKALAAKALKRLS